MSGEDSEGSSMVSYLPSKSGVITGLKWFFHIVLWILVLGSVGWVLQSDYHASIQFLGFVAMFLIVTVITWPLTTPLHE